MEKSSEISFGRYTATVVTAAFLLNAAAEAAAYLMNGADYSFDPKQFMFTQCSIVLGSIIPKLLYK